MSRITPLTGFPEWLPRERIVEQRFLDTLRQTFELHGFTGIETRAVEPVDFLLRKGEIDKEVYRSALYGQGKGTEEVRFTSSFSPGTYPAQIEYRYYYHNGMLHYMDSQTREITIIAE